MFEYKSFLSTLTERPGIYTMQDKHGSVIYVGKAKNLKSRVSSYFQKSLDNKTSNLVNNIAKIEVTITNSEKEALLLESTLIKKLLPKYNILLRDDKFYPYIYVAMQDEFPKVIFYRGVKQEQGRYFGPYTNPYAVKESLQLLKKIFKVRDCSDSFFKHRTRPCIQYQIKRCSAPCVGYISTIDYAKDIKNLELFLSGKDKEIISNLIEEMEVASSLEKYEEAVIVRDKIAALRKMQEQHANAKDGRDLDVLSAQIIQEVACVYMLSIRYGEVVGGQEFFLKLNSGNGEIIANYSSELLRNFILQFYVNAEEGTKLPQEIILNFALDESKTIEELLFDKFNLPVKVSHDLSGMRKTWLLMAENNAVQAIKTRLVASSVYFNRIHALQKVLGYSFILTRFECFDISHTQGDETVASCVVFDDRGPLKSAYRLFKLAQNLNGDDYKGMEEVLRRRFAQDNRDHLPQIIFIDGGKGQLAVAKKVLAEFGLLEIIIVGISKGKERKSGLEKIYLAQHDIEQEPLQIDLKPEDPALQLILQIRDEAHRFAITSHRKSRAKKSISSVLQEIKGIGHKRHQALINYFGGLKDLRSASQEEIAKVPGISLLKAQEIYLFLHGE